MSNPTHSNRFHERSRIIVAGRQLTCAGCGATIFRGERAWYANCREAGYRCSGCGQHPVGSNIRPATPPASSSRKPKRPSLPLPAMDTARPTAAYRGADGVHRYEFASIGEAVADALDDYAQNDGNRERIRDSQNSALSGRDRWGNYFTRERLLGELTNPSAELLGAVDEMRQLLVEQIATPSSPRRKVRRGLDWGEELDPDRWLIREPNSWERTMREAQPRRTVTIGCNITVNAGIRPEQLLYRGAAALALADMLTSRGLNVAIVLFKSVSDPSTTVSQGVIRYSLKDATMPLDLGACTFAMCEIAFSRIVGVCGEARHWPGRLASGMGRGSSLPRADRQGLDYIIDADVLSRQAAEEWLKHQMQEKEVANV